jgi:tripartite motif-containing protein 2/3
LTELVQVQLFTKHGQFIRKFGADVLQHPRGVAVDVWGRIVVVECKVMRVVIFDMMGNVLNKFSCSRHLEFPNGVAVNDQMEIFISDNRAHCVKVFDYQGNYLRQIGGEGVCNFPIGVGITASGDIAIADNHNNFNLTVFSQAGQVLQTSHGLLSFLALIETNLVDFNLHLLLSS